MSKPYDDMYPYYAHLPYAIQGGSGISPYQGGLPIYPYHSTRQRGSGFFSAAKRFLVPLAKTGLKELVGGVGDVISGRKSAKDALLERGGNLAKSALVQGKDMVMERIRGGKRPAPSRRAAPPAKVRKKAPAKKRPQRGKKRRPTFK